MKKRRAEIRGMDNISRAIKRRVLALSEMQGANTVFCYVSFGTETATHELIRSLIHEGKSVCVPKTHQSGLMDAVLIDGLSELKPGDFTALEPEDGKIVEKTDIDIVIIPALCYDKLGYRLGYGKGFYDRYLEDFNGLKVGLCPDECLVPDAYHDAHDVKADIIVTQSEVIYPAEKHERTL
ncbi:MAG: 5-formyltetrahydrofolate cyclo-ligase [Clostridia bacterium]|nr:5-formyltetrahydrofolate cyclo-ligase [Clostridia bacterium]